MTKQDFISYLNAPEKLNGHSVDALEKLVNEYPYFQTARLLFLKNLHNQNSIDYEKNLHITSAYAPSGKVLFNLIKKKPAEKLEVRSEKLEVEQTIIKEEILSKEIPIVQEIKTDEYDELQLLEKEMLREAYRTSLTIDLLEEKDASTSLSITKSETLNSKLGTYSFNDWLKVIGGKNPEQKSDASASLSVTKKSKSEIIDKFILEETAKATPKQKVEFYSADTMAKKSIQDDETFVSETLAGIYLKQGNLPKALRAYEILVVKYPEKIHIFAPLLEKIKKLLKDQKGK